MHLRLALLLLFVLFYNSFFAQVTVLGKFSIGDSTNLQLLETNRGDYFRGWVSSWISDSIVFVTDNDLQIAFPVSAVKSIQVGAGNHAGGLGTELFELKTKDGKVYYGFPTKITQKTLYFDASSAGFLRLNHKDIISMEPITVAYISREPYSNEYAVKSNSENVRDGRFLGLRNGNIEHIDLRGNYHEIGIEKLGKYKLTGQRLPYQGEGRSLMFAQTGFGMKPKEKEYRNILVGINIFSAGVSENVSVAAGLVSFLPYADLKISQSLGKYLHASVGGYVFVPFSVGVHGALSIGTPDYFLNLGYNRNFENKQLYADVEFENFNFGASVRTGKRSRVFAEYHIMTSDFDRNSFGSSTFYQTGYANAFSWGYGWYNTRFRFETGVVQTGPYWSWSCFGPDCNEYYYVPVPFISMAVRFRR